MATQPVQAPESEVPKPKRIPELSGSYRKAHKSYVLVAGLLASWELIGIDPEKLGERWGVVLKSPKGVPLILFTLLLYCAYKVVIEWMQCDPQRRRHRAAMLDYGVAHLIAIVALLIALVQYLARVQIVDVLARHVTPLYGLPVGFCIFMLLVSAENLRIRLRVHKHKEGNDPEWRRLILRKWFLKLSLYFVGYVASIILLLGRLTFVARSSLVGIILGIFYVVMRERSLRQWVKRYAELSRKVTP